MSDHRPEPWRAEQSSWSDDGWLVRSDSHVIFFQTGSLARANAERTAACVNFCANYTNEELEQKVSLAASDMDAMHQLQEAIVHIKGIVENWESGDLALAVNMAREWAEWQEKTDV